MLHESFYYEDQARDFDYTRYYLIAGTYGWFDNSTMSGLRDSHGLIASCSVLVVEFPSRVSRFKI